MSLSVKITNEQISYNTYVHRGKELLSMIEGYQFEICELAMRVCEISNGGNGSQNKYTIGRYAIDIGMKENTMRKWLQAYREVYMKNPDLFKNKTSKEWSIIGKINKILKEENRIARVKEGRTGSKKRPVKHTGRDISNLYKNVMEEKPFVAEFREVRKYVKRLEGWLGKKDFSILDYDAKVELMELLDKCSDGLNDILSKERNKR